jgi:hypothetical protein
MSRQALVIISCDRCGDDLSRALSPGQRPIRPDLCEPCEDIIADAVLTGHRNSVRLLDRLVTDVERVVKRWSERRKAQEGDR